MLLTLCTSHSLVFESSIGQMLASPANGATVMVLSDSWMRLELNPPSMTRCPRYLPGRWPEKTGMKAELVMAWISSALEAKFSQTVLEPSMILVTDMYRRPLEIMWMLSGKS